MLYEKFHLNKSLANINYFRKITEDNQESILFPLTFFEGENVEGDSIVDTGPLS